MVQSVDNPATQGTITPTPTPNPVAPAPVTPAPVTPHREPLTMKSLLEAGVHFGHQTRRWNPSMKRYIFTQRNGIHIIDLQQTLGLDKRGVPGHGARSPPRGARSCSSAPRSRPRK